MSRSGYIDDYEFLDLYRANVDRAIAGKRGQAFLKEMAAAMDRMPEKVLIVGKLIDAAGNCCAIGTVCKARGLDISGVDYEDPEAVGRLVKISRSLAAEIEFENDDKDGWRPTTPAERWQRMRNWIDENLT